MFSSTIQNFLSDTWGNEPGDYLTSMLSRCLGISRVIASIFLTSFVTTRPNPTGSIPPVGFGPVVTIILINNLLVTTSSISRPDGGLVVLYSGKV
jgi:hypothetical protein